MKPPHITRLRFTPGTICFNLDGKRVWDRTVVSPFVPMVGHYTLKSPVVRVDKKITAPQERRSIFLHEAIERAERQRGLSPHQAHLMAEAAERREARHSGLRWGTYSRHVERAFRLNRRAGIRRRR